MNNIHPDEMDLAAQQDVITLCDYETCPTIKRNNGSNTLIVVKSDGNLHSNEARTNHSANNHYESLENGALGLVPQ